MEASESAAGERRSPIDPELFEAIEPIVQEARDAFVPYREAGGWIAAEEMVFEYGEFTLACRS